MDYLSLTNKYRERLCEYLKSHLGQDEYIWARRLISDMNRRLIYFEEDDNPAHIMILYKNFQPYFERIRNVTASDLLLTLYMCSIQLGFRELGDVVESYPQFIDGVDMDDWANVDKNTIYKFDLYQALMLVNNALGHDVDAEDRFYACGIHTLQTMDFI